MYISIHNPKPYAYGMGAWNTCIGPDDVISGTTGAGMTGAGMTGAGMTGAGTTISMMDKVGVEGG